MKKIFELEDKSSCLNRAFGNEHLFVLLGRDKAAPAAIRAWCAERIRRRMNLPTDELLVTAEALALTMEREYRCVRHDLRLQRDRARRREAKATAPWVAWRVSARGEQFLGEYAIVAQSASAARWRMVKFAKQEDDAGLQFREVTVARWKQGDEWAKQRNALGEMPPLGWDVARLSVLVHGPR